MVCMMYSEFHLVASCLRRLLGVVRRHLLTRSAANALGGVVGHMVWIHLVASAGFMLDHFIAYLPCHRFTSSLSIVVPPVMIYRRTSSCSCTSLASSASWSSGMLTVGLARDCQLGFCIKSSSSESCLGMCQLFVGASIALGKGMNRADDHARLRCLVYLLGPLPVVTS